ncbi:hypothetical protein B5S28_g768 [[Candida] boidinii]|nr:hypothetical protein B5S28_g768 [[Candida] boidinii]OWB60707.1 hypothetical protein B5S29_g1587 [[Candida] boidinii]OWB72185.1 hypothetical protein B5S31_g1891 [[Candida] boidinii]OWB77823.1 hypothetical protein B5S32_g2001 [[Candida] boidinii]
MFQLFKSNKTKYFGFRGDKLHTLVTILASVSFTLFGYDQGVMSSMLTLPEFNHYFPEINAMEDSSKSTLQGFTVAIYEIGCMSGALFAMFFGDRFGRKRMIWMGSLIMGIGAILETAAYGLPQLIVGRVVCGVGNGLNTATVPSWLSECARPERRGILNMISAALNILGVMTSYWIGFGFYFVDNSANWRFPMAFQCVFAIIMLLFIMEMPESPRWLIREGHIEEAIDTFAHLEDSTIDDPEIIAKVEEIQALIRVEGPGIPIKKMFTFGKHRHFHRAMLACFTQVMQQVCGINLITYYASTIFEQYLGMSPLNSRILAACNGTEYFLAACVSIFVIERVGRRLLMIICAAGQAVTMLILFVTAYLADKKDNSNAAIGAAVFLFVFNTFFAIGWLGIPWLYPAEISGLEIRAAVNGLSTACNWVFTFLIVMITPICFSHIGSFTYIIFAGVNSLMVPACIIFYPETAGKSLEDMDKIFEQIDPRTPWDVVKVAAEYVPDYAVEKQVLEFQEKPSIQQSESVSVSSGV